MTNLMVASRPRRSFLAEQGGVHPPNPFNPAPATGARFAVRKP